MATGANKAWFVYRLTGTTVPNNTLTAISWELEALDDAGYWALTPDPTRVTFPVDGFYDVEFCVRWGNFSSAGCRQLQLRKNGASILAMSTGNPLVTFGHVQQVGASAFFSAGDYLEALVHQDSGISDAINPVGHAPLCSIQGSKVLS